MDCFGGKKKSCKDQCEIAEKVRLLKEEIKAIVSEREKESRDYEREMTVFALKEAEWKQERKKLKAEVKRLRKMVEEKEEKNEVFVSSGNDTAAASSLLVEQMRDERLWRDEAVDKWKKLYLAIKTELDDLIQITHRGDGLCWKAEEMDTIEELKLEMKAKDETIEKLKARLAILEQEECKRAIEIDILRQSLRIMSSKKSSSKPKLAILVKQARKT